MTDNGNKHLAVAKLGMCKGNHGVANKPTSLRLQEKKKKHFRSKLGIYWQIKPTKLPVCSTDVMMISTDNNRSLSANGKPDTKHKAHSSLFVSTQAYVHKAGSSPLPAKFECSTDQNGPGRITHTQKKTRDTVFTRDCQSHLTQANVCWPLQGANPIVTHDDGGQQGGVDHGHR